MDAITVEIIWSSLFALSTAVIYLKWHKWKVNPFTRAFALLVTGFALILTYVVYNVLAKIFGWFIASGTLVAVLVYGLIAVIETVLFGVVLYLTFVKKDV